MSRIFISYSRNNIDAAEYIAAHLIKRAASVFIDYESLNVGENFPERLADEIDQCEAVIFLLSEYSAASKWVRSEIQYAFNKDKPIYPVSLDATKPPKSMFFLSGIHAIDFRAWHESVKGEIAMRKLALALGLQEPTVPIKSERQSAQQTHTQNSQGESPFSSLPTFDKSQKLVGDSDSSASILVPQKFPKLDSANVSRVLKPNWVGSDKLLPEPFDWCVVTRGKVTLADLGGYLTEILTIEIPEFQISRYPITNAQFGVFVTADDGWRLPKWWSYSLNAAEWRDKNPQSDAAAFKDCFNCPRETVTWYAAVAFTHWLSEKTGEAITLPTETQWQRAAQGDDGRAFPWGNEWDASKCNSGGSNSGTTTSVTLYPQGSSPFGVLDMSGNVWEWSLTDWQTGNTNLVGSGNRVLRGGSWGPSSRFPRCIVRDFDDPGNWSYRFGFRLVMNSFPK